MAGLVLATGLSLPVLPAVAGPYADDFGKCLVSSATEQDKQALMRWMFGAMTRHPGLAGLSAMSDARHAAADRDAAALFQRLVTRTCVATAREALKYEGAVAFGTAFELLGKVASTEIFDDPAVEAGLQGMLRQIDEEQLKQALGPKAK